jgi:hypothetical protein
MANKSGVEYLAQHPGWKTKRKMFHRPARKTIPDPDGQNKDRAIWAGVAIAAFQSITKTDDCDAVKDLLCDLMHYCQQNDEDFDVALDAARHHHTAETTEA